MIAYSGMALWVGHYGLCDTLLYSIGPAWP